MHLKRMIIKDQGDPGLPFSDSLNSFATVSEGCMLFLRIRNVLILWLPILMTTLVACGDGGGGGGGGGGADGTIVTKVWGTPISVDGTNNTITAVELSASPSGNIVVGWSESYQKADMSYYAQIAINYYTTSNGWSGRTVIGNESPAGIGYLSPDVSINDNGDIGVCVSNGWGTNVYRHSVSSGWSSFVIPNITSSKIEMLPNGEIHVVGFIESGSQDSLGYYSISNNGTLSSQETIATNVTNSAFDFVLNSSGTGVVVYEGTAIVGNDINAIIYDPIGGWGANEPIGAGNGGATSFPNVCISENNHISAVWGLYNSSSDTYSIWGSYYVNGSWSYAKVRELEANSTSPNPYIYPISINSTGLSYLVFDNASGVGASSINALNVTNYIGVFDIGHQPSVVAGEDGLAYIVYSSSDGFQDSLYFAPYDPINGFTNPYLIEDIESGDVSVPKLVSFDDDSLVAAFLVDEPGMRRSVYVVIYQ